MIKDPSHKQIHFLNNDELIRKDGIKLQNHELTEQLMFINMLDDNEKNALIKIINSILTKNA